MIRDGRDAGKVDCGMGWSLQLLEYGKVDARILFMVHMVVNYCRIISLRFFDLK